MLTGLDLPGRAALLGISCRDYVAIAERDARIVANVANATAGAVTRLKRWIAAGMPVPAPDLDRLEFAGFAEDVVRELVADVLRRVPAPVAWHGCEFVTWFSVGGGAKAWQGIAPVMRAPADDQAHVIAIAAEFADEGLVAHELGHSWASAVLPMMPRVPRMPRQELNARAIVAERFVAQHAGGTSTATDRIVRSRVAEEQLADDLARLWGFERHTDYAALAQHFRNEVAAASARADEIEQDIEDDIRNAG